MGPVPLEKQWTLWPRIARPFECKTCGAEYGPTFDDEVECKARQFMRATAPTDCLPYPFTGWGVGHGRTHHRVPRWRYCRNRDCPRFYNYEEERQRLLIGRDTTILLLAKRDRLPMRRKWLKPLPAANDGP